MTKKRAMVRKQLYIEPEQNTFLRECAAKYNVSEGQIVREAIGMFSKTVRQSVDVDLNAWEEELKFIRCRQDMTKDASMQKWVRGELYDR